MNMKFRSQDIAEMERRFRGTLINSLGGYKSAVLVGTADFQGQCNLAIFNSLFHVGADPALWGMVVRPCVPGKNTLGNILSTEVFTLNHITPSMMERAHQCSAKYPEGVNEFEEVGLAAEFWDGFIAPFVKDSPVKVACELVKTVDLELNGTTLVIGKLSQVELPGHAILKDGFVDLIACETLASSGLDGYARIDETIRLSYAKTSENPQEIFSRNRAENS
jgi:flavin reductase (DIM6/NTAB) family NADH-FMN oxidoreductase RutF